MLISSPSAQLALLSALAIVSSTAGASPLPSPLHSQVRPLSCHLVGLAKLTEVLLTFSRPWALTLLTVQRPLPCEVEVPRQLAVPTIVGPYSLLSSLFARRLNLSNSVSRNSSSLARQGSQDALREARRRKRSQAAREAGDGQGQGIRRKEDDG